MILTEQPQQIKIHKPLLNGIASSLAMIFNENRYSDKVLEKLFKQNKQWGSRDRKFVAESVYDITRHFSLLTHLAQTKNNYWFITSVYFVLKNIELPSWPEFKHVNKELIIVEYENLRTDFNTFNSYPEVLAEVCTQELGKEKWEREALAMNTMAEVVLRVNTLKTNTAELQKKLLGEKIETEKLKDHENTLILKKRGNVFSTAAFKEGLFEIQDQGSQQIVVFCKPEPKQFVIDACAGAGGKSLALAALMQNKGRIISMDVGQWKLDELAKRAKRAGAFNIETKLIDKPEAMERYKEKADLVLLDVPCSGLGVLKRNPDTKWKFNIATFGKTKELQQQILNDYSTMVKLGGTLVYSTCSILPSENEEQVKLFIQKNNSFVIIDEKMIYPSEGFDGFYMCKLKRN
ncbi:MAG: RsmB/NOP family class I SAM-dependent RNA methyltransferase [Bacteroidota bacterium]|nr:RsmB/NOP family class I SAM-dependent RNA methyltransferase [Bacteroidota bacterium]